ncbi:protein SFI1 homolog [Megalops cyprinoides]|uniref:protein SFI1 homolog n=1 Tax=Megalops cyprinoides TaxID=118141 RepID=UPI001863AAD8|nr:protein SFI1 homolog [Megalops cyprinoides]
MEKARQNHHRVLLRSSLRAWHLQHCQHKHKKAMKGQADGFQERKICLHHFTFWKRQLILRRDDAEHTEVALWHWSLSLQAKVMEAWRGWIVERRQMRDRLAHAAQFHRDQLLREGVAHILTYTADMGSFRVSLALQTQEQSARRLQSVVRHCAMRWKQQALCKPDGCRSRHHKKSVISCLPVPDSASESTSKDTSTGHALEQGPRDCTSNEWVFVRASSLQPRIPDHLLNSLDTEVAPRPTPSSTQLLPSHPICTSDRDGKGQASPLDQPLFQTTSTIQETPPVGQTGCWHEPPDQELLPPSSFMTTGVTTHSSQREVNQPNKKLNNSQPPVPTGGVCEGSNKDKVEEMGMNVMDPQPSPYSTFALTKELLRVRQEMHRFQQEKKQLQSWRRLAEVLRSWLHTNANLAETECHTTRLELEELEARISRLAKQLEEEKPVMRQYATMIKNIASRLRDTDL